MTEDEIAAGRPDHVDPQDRAFGAAAARDEDRVEELNEERIDEDALPDQRDGAPRAGGKARPGRRVIRR